MSYFPLFIEMEGQRVLMVGVGAVGLRRLLRLMEFGASVTVVDRDPSPELRRLQEEQRIELVAEDYRLCREQLPGGYFLVLAATGSLAIDSLAVEDGKRQGAFVNLAGDKGSSDFYFPGIARNGQVIAGITAEGKNHALAAEAVRKIQHCLDNEEEDGKEWR